MSSANATLGRDTRETLRLGREYLELGLRVYYAPRGEKRMGAGNEVGDEDLLETVFPHDAANNIGVRLTGNMVDVEIDSPGSAAMADDFLPHTGAVFGRTTKPRSHRIYGVEGGAETLKRAGKVDVWTARSNQTINFPPSLHPSTERTLWGEPGPGSPGFEITEVRTEVLQKSVRMLATADGIAGATPGDDRHGFLRAISGFLLRKGVEPEDVKRVLSSVWRYLRIRKDGREAASEVERLVESARERLETGHGPVQGEPSLQEYAPGLSQAITKIWGWDTSAERVEELIERVEKDKDPSILDKSAYDALAGVSVADYIVAKRRLVKALGKGLNQNDLDAAVREAWQARKVRAGAAEPDEPTHDELGDRWLDGAGSEYAHGRGEWKHYEGGVWSPVQDALVRRQIKAVCVAAKPEGTKPTSNLVASVTELVRVEVVVPDEAWDADPDVLVCENGALHIPTRELRSHDRKHHATSAVPYAYAPEARAPMWARFMREVIAPAVGDEGVEFLQEFAGYALTTDVGHEIAVWLTGPPGGGRSTLIMGLEAMLGERAGALSLHELERSRFALSGIPGKTLLTATEQPAGYTSATHTLNRLISGDKMPVEEKFKPTYEVYPTAKLLWAMNDLPRVSSSNDGIFRRVRVVALPDPIRNKDPDVKAAIVREGAGILNWSLEGLARLRERGYFETPEAVKNATEQWRDTNDVAALFVAERCEVGKDHEVRAGLLYDAYKQWCLDNGFKPKNSNNAAEDWRRLGFEQARDKKGSLWRGVRILLQAVSDSGFGILAG